MKLIFNPKFFKSKDQKSMEKLQNLLINTTFQLISATEILFKKNITFSLERKKLAFYGNFLLKNYTSKQQTN